MNGIDARLAAYGPILAKAFITHKLPVVWALAIAATESSFRPYAENHSAGDASRGGSYGLCQLSLATAREFAPSATPGDLLDPRRNAEIAALLCARLRRQYGDDFSDIVSAYNSGRPLERAPASTRDIHVPRALQNLKLYAAQAAEWEQLYAIN